MNRNDAKKRIKNHAMLLPQSNTHAQIWFTLFIEIMRSPTEVWAPEEQLFNGGRKMVVGRMIDDFAFRRMPGVVRAAKRVSHSLVSSQPKRTIPPPTLSQMTELNFPGDSNDSVAIPCEHLMTQQSMGRTQLCHDMHFISESRTSSPGASKVSKFQTASAS